MCRTSARKFYAGQYRFVRTMPLLFSPVDPHILYLGSNVLFKTTNGGDQLGSHQSGSDAQAMADAGSDSSIRIARSAKKGSTEA